MGKSERKADDRAKSLASSWGPIIALVCLFILLLTIIVLEGAEAIPEPMWAPVGMVIGYMVGGRSSD